MFSNFQSNVFLSLFSISNKNKNKKHLNQTPLELLLGSNLNIALTEQYNVRPKLPAFSDLTITFCTFYYIF